MHTGVESGEKIRATNGPVLYSTYVRYDKDNSEYGATLRRACVIIGPSRKKRERSGDVETRVVA